MSDYYLSGGYSETGENIVLEVSWTHKWSELRCLCVVDDKEHQEFKVLNSNSILGSDGRYTIVYPFSVKGLSWRAYLWRETTKNRTISYDGGRIPVEAMLSKIAELSDKADEAKVLLERVMMFPEDTDGKMFIPPVNVRKGELLGFDDEGKPVVGEACKQVKDLMNAQDACDDAVIQAGIYAQHAAQSASEAGKHSFDANESVVTAESLVDKAQGHALDAQAWHQKTADTGSKAINDVNLIVGNAEQYAENAEASAVRAEEAAAGIELNKEELDKKLCYVGCAVKRVDLVEGQINETAGNATSNITNTAQGAISEVGAAVEQAKSDLEAAKDAAIEECEATLANVYTKDQVYTKQETDSALGLKADATALEAETQAREQADSALGERIDANAEVIAENRANIAAQKISIPANYLFARGSNFAGEPLYEITAATAAMPSDYSAPTNLNGAFAYCKNLRKVILGGRYPVLKSPFSRDDIFTGCENIEEICTPMVDSSGNPLYKARNHVGDWTGEYTTEQLINPKTGELEPQALDNGLRYMRKESSNTFRVLMRYSGRNLGDFFCCMRTAFQYTTFTQNEVYIGDCIGYEPGYSDQWFLSYTGDKNPKCVKHVGDFIKVPAIGAFMFYEAGKYTVGDFLAVTNFYGSDSLSHGFVAHKTECLGIGVFPKLKNGYAHFNGSTIPVMNIARLLRSLPIWADDQEHTLTLTKFASKLDEQVSFRQCYKDGNPVDEVTVVSTTLRAEIEDCVNRKGWTISY